VIPILCLATVGASAIGSSTVETVPLWQDPEFERQFTVTSFGIGMTAILGFFGFILRERHQQAKLARAIWAEISTIVSIARSHPSPSREPGALSTMLKRTISVYSDSPSSIGQFVGDLPPRISRFYGTIKSAQEKSSFEAEDFLRRKVISEGEELLEILGPYKKVFKYRGP